MTRYRFREKVMALRLPEDVQSFIRCCAMQKRRVATDVGAMASRDSNE